MKYIKDLISVIIPTYNRAHLLKRSILSVLEQDYPFIEVIVVDDCSTDNTKSIIDDLNDERVRYVRLEKNGGSAFARNYGIKMARGQYIAFQDSDDLFLSNKLSKQLKNLKKHNSDMDFCRICIHLKNEDYFLPTDSQIYSIKKKNILNELCKGNFISTQAILIKSECIKKFLFDPEMPRYQDYDLIMRMIHCINISYTNSILVELFRQEDSISENIFKLKDALNLILAKDYRLSDSQKYDLLNWITKSYINESIGILNTKNAAIDYYEKELNKFVKENSKLITENAKIINQNIELNSNNSKLNASLKKMTDNYNNLYFSKRVKFINKILSILKK